MILCVNWRSSENKEFSVYLHTGINLYKLPDSNSITLNLYSRDKIYVREQSNSFTYSIHDASEFYGFSGLFHICIWDTLNKGILDCTVDFPNIRSFTTLSKKQWKESPDFINFSKQRS